MVTRDEYEHVGSLGGLILSNENEALVIILRMYLRKYLRINSIYLKIHKWQL